MFARRLSFVVALILCAFAVTTSAQGQTPARRPLADQIAEGLPEEIFDPPYSAVVTELIMPPGSVAGVSTPLPVTRIRYAAVPFFAFDSATLDHRARQTTRNIARLLRRLDGVAGIVIGGHTDSVGSETYNLDLARRRGEAVQRALIEDGVDARIISIIPLGERYPIATNSTDEGRAMNRRVEFYVASRADVAREAVRTSNYDLSFQNNHPACARTPDSANCRRIGAGSAPVFDANGRHIGDVDMTDRVAARERVVRRPLPERERQPGRRPLPSQ